MLAAPDDFFVEETLTKNVDAINRKIRTIRRNIGHYKQVLENPKKYPREHEICPGPDVFLNYERERLEYAKAALNTIGASYEPTAREVRNEKFNEKLDNVKFLNFTICNIPGKPHKYKLDFPNEFFDSEDLKSLYIGEWKHKYVDKDIVDGFAWNLTIEYNNDIKKDVFEGHNKIPFSFNDLIRLCEEYKMLSIKII